MKRNEDTQTTQKVFRCFGTWDQNLLDQLPKRPTFSTFFHGFQIWEAMLVARLDSAVTPATKGMGATRGDATARGESTALGDLAAETGP